MPATATHAYFVKDVFDVLPQKISSIANIGQAVHFTQGADALKFYNYWSLYNGKKIRHLDYVFHSKNSQEFFICILDYIRDYGLTDEDVFSFLIGHICHYVLDSMLHPYIIYKTGMFRKDDPSTYKYNNVHTFCETFLDNDMIRRREKINPYKYNIAKTCFSKFAYSDNLRNLIDNSYYEVFNYNQFHKIYFKSLRQMKKFIRLYRHDRFGLKKCAYKLVDTFTPKKCFKFEALSYHYTLKDKHNFLNLNNSLWHHPTSYDITSSESFIDLYIKAIKKAKSIINSSFDYVNGKNINLKKVFDNSSYISGLNCENEKELKFFEF